jgi:L-aminopeptidase/D-esterase-like protein
MITNTHSVGVVRDAVIAWRIKQAPPDAEGYSWSLPIVAETADDDLNDMNGFHVKPEHAFHALESAHGGAAEEGNVGGGTGMICNEFKGGIGTASRLLPREAGRLHRRRARAVQLRAAQPAAHRRRAGRQGDPGPYRARTKTSARSSSSSRPTRR